MQSMNESKPGTSVPMLMPWQAAAIAALVTIAVAVFFYWGKFQGNITGFFRIGDVLPFSPYLDASQAIIATGELGYDGQQFLTLAFDPLIRNPLTLEALDNPIYRYSRILYPLLGHVLALGRHSLIPYSLVLINLACLPLMVWRIAQGLGDECRTWQLKESDASAQAEWSKQSWVALLTLAIPGVWIALAFSTADLLSSTLVVFAITAQRASALRSNRRNGLAWQVAVPLALACLARETMLLVWLALLVVNLWERRWKQGLAISIAALPVMGWNLHVKQLFPQVTGVEVGRILDFPLSGFVRKLGTLSVEGLTAKTVFEGYAFLLLIAVFAMTILVSFYTKERNLVILLCACFSGALFSISSDAILWYFAGYLRVYSDAFLFLLMLYLPRALKFKAIPLLMALPLTFAFVFLST